MANKQTKMGRPTIGDKRGIDVRQETLNAEGSPRARKRRQIDQSLPPDEAAVQRARNADRARKSQILKKLRDSTAYQTASSANRAAMEEAAVEDLEQHRKSTGQHATAKEPEAFYDSMDDFRTSSDEQGDTEEEEVSSDSGSELAVGDGEDSDKEEALTKDEVEEAQARGRENTGLLTRFISGGGLEALLQGDYDRAKRRYEETPSDKRKARYIQAKADLAQFRKDQEIIGGYEGDNEDDGGSKTNDAEPHDDDDETED